jgi:catechol 1,2-dioxygenase
MDGVVRDEAGNPLPGSIVDVWHADSKGGYSHFDPTQAEYNLRRRIRTDAQGRYRFRSLVPSGYGVPPGSPTEQMLDLLGRHGQRPAHIHFLVTDAGKRPLTTQINIPGDAYLEDDFAFATRDGLIVELDPTDKVADVASLGVNVKHIRVHFDFQLQAE